MVIRLLRFMFENLYEILAYILGALSNDIYVNVSGKDQINCGSIDKPCRSLSFTVNKVSSNNDKIFLIASSIKQIRYKLENAIVIKHSLTVTKFPRNSQNPVITYHFNVRSNRKQVYAFAISRYVVVPEVLTLDFKSVNFNVNIFTTFSEGCKALQRNVVVGNISDFQLSLSISDSIIRSPFHAINLTDISGYEKVSIHLKNLEVVSGDFMFQTRSERCEHKEYIKNTVEMNDVRVCNTGNVTLSVNGCFNVSVEKLMCSNFTWKRQELFTFTGGILNAENVLVSNMKHNNSKKKALFQIYESVAEIHNMVIKDNVGVRPQGILTLIIIENSSVKILNVEMVGNSFQRVTRAHRSSLYVKNMTLSGNNFEDELCTVEKSSVTLHETKFYRNKIGCLVYINLNSKVLIMSSSVIENEIFKYSYYVDRSYMELNNTKFHSNINHAMFAESQSHIFIDNLTLTNNHMVGAINILRKSKLELYNAAILGNKFNCYFLRMKSNSRALIQNNTLTENNVQNVTVYYLRENCAIQLSNVKFIRNMFHYFLDIKDNSSAIIQNNTLIENNAKEGRSIHCVVYYLRDNCSIQLSNVKFIRNRFLKLLQMYYHSSAIIQNNTLLENNVNKRGIFYSAVYCLWYNCTIQLINVKFIRNRLKKVLQFFKNCSAIIQNNTLTENNFEKVAAYFLSKHCTIQLINVKFIRNRFHELLEMYGHSSAIIQNNTLLENNVSKGILYSAVYYFSHNCTIQLINVKFIRNRLHQLLYLRGRNSSAVIQNNTFTENNVSNVGFRLLENCSIRLNNVKFIRNRLHQLLDIDDNSSAIIHNNTLTKNSFKGNFLDMHGNSTARLINNTMVGNIDLDLVFFARSSDLEINAIRIESNTFSQLISVVQCKVSFESMRIRENNVADGMIYIENTDGKMADTYIENSDSFMASAFTITCTYIRNRYYRFEFANIEIIWSYKLQISARPIISLSGKVFISNVKLLVTSLSEIEVLRYSTKDVKLPNKYTRSEIETFSNSYHITSSFIGCTKANVKRIKNADTFRCIPCGRSTYTINNGSLHLSTSLQSSKTIIPENVTNFTCLNCPVGANCAVSIKSKSNFYGYETKEQQLKFLPCPRGFCCTGSQCNTIKSCNKNRIGTLCGRCIDNYVESFISPKCISIHSCQNFGIFWLVYCTYALILATFLYYMKDFICLIKSLGSMCKIFQPRRREKESEDEIYVTIGIAEAEENRDKISHFTVSGIFNIITSFYQIRQLMTVDVQFKNLNGFLLITSISNFFNLEIVAVTYSSYCPMSNLDAVSKKFIKTYLLTAILLIASLTHYFMSRVFNSFHPSLQRGSSLILSDRLGVCFIRILMFSYKNMASASLIFLKCIEVAGVRVLFIKGDMECYQWWQIVIAVFLLTWILFFPLSLKISFNMFMRDKISFSKFILCLVAPFVLVADCFLNRNVVFVNLQKSRDLSESEVKTILKEIFEESYRIKIEDSRDSREETVFYETWRLYQRVLLAIVATFCIDPIVRITFMTPTVILIAVSYFMISPYKREMYILRWMEAFSILGFFVCLGQTMFRGFLYVYDINDGDSVKLVWQVFTILDLIFSPILFLICFFIMKPIYSKVKCKITSIYLTVRRRYGKIFS